MNVLAKVQLLVFRIVSALRNFGFQNNLNARRMQGVLATLISMCGLLVITKCHTRMKNLSECV